MASGLGSLDGSVERKSDKDDVRRSPTAIRADDVGSQKVRKSAGGLSKNDADEGKSRKSSPAKS